MRDFFSWLEAVATQSRVQLSTGNGGGWGNDINDDDGRGDDDDYENGPWGWKHMQSLSLKLDAWIKSSPFAAKIKGIVVEHLFERTPPQMQVRVFPGHAQFEIWWNLNLHKWSDMDESLEGLLKRSDLYKPLGITPDQLWSVIDRGAVYDYTLHAIMLNLTSRVNVRNSYVDLQAASYAYQIVHREWQRLKPTILQHIQDFHHENELGQVQIQIGDPKTFPRVHSVSQVHGGNLWTQSRIMIPYHVIGQRQENPDGGFWDSWGKERPINH